MARTFVAASSQYLKVTAAPATAAPLTLAAWVKPTAQTSASFRMGVSISHAAVNGAVFDVRLDTTGAVTAQAYDGTSNGLATTAALVTAGAWQHIAAVFTSTTSRAVFLGGANKVTNATSSTPTGLDTTGIGVYVDNANNNFFDGDIGEAAIWNAALDDAEVAALAAGVSPLLVRQTALVAYWPLIGQYSPEIDVRGRNELTVTGATAGAHCRIFYPIGPTFKTGARTASTFAADATLTFASTAALRASSRFAADATLTFASTAALRAASRLAADATLSFTSTANLVFPSTVTVTIGGTDRTAYVNRYECDITDQLNEIPNTASLMVRGFTPTVGQQVTILVGNTKVFDGLATEVTQVQRRTGTRLRYRLTCLDWTFLLDRRLVNANYSSQAADVVAAAIMSSFTTGFTTTNVQSGLSTVTMPNKMETVSQALTRLANLAGAFWYIDYDKDLHFRTADNLTNPSTLATGNAAFKQLTYRRSIQQIRTRIYVEGKGSTATALIAVGNTTIPVVDHSIFQLTGGLVTSGPQLISYTGKGFGDPAAQSWTARTPSSSVVAWFDVVWADTLGLFVAVGNGTVMTSPDGVTWTARTAAEGNPWFAVTWASSLGLLVAVASTGTHQVMTSSNGITWTSRTAAAAKVWADITWAPSLSLLVAVAADAVMTSPDGINWTSRTPSIADLVNGVAWSPSLSLFVAVAANAASTSTVMTSPDGTTWTTRTASTASAWTDLTWSADLNLFVAVSTSAGSNVMTSPDGITWTTRTTPTSANWTNVTWASGLALFVAVSGGTLSQVMTSPDGTTWTSGVVDVTGVWNSVAWSPDVGRLVAVGAQTGAADVMTNGYNVLSGVPTSGTGAVLVAINEGDDVNLVVQCDDTAAQTALAALETGDGIHEHYIQDRRLSNAGATARGNAELTLGKDPDEIATYTSEDVNVFSGRSQVINISSISTTLRIQRVRIYWIPGRKWAQRDVTATNRLKDFYQLVRDLSDKANKVA